MPPSPLKMCPQVLIIKAEAEGDYSSPSHYFFKYLFPPTAERGGGNYDLLYRNSIRKHKDDLEHQVIYISYDF